MFNLIFFLVVLVLGYVLLYRRFPFYSYHISDSEKVGLSFVLLCWPLIIPPYLIYASEKNGWLNKALWFSTGTMITICFVSVYSWLWGDNIFFSDPITGFNLTLWELFILFIFIKTK